MIRGDVVAWVLSSQQSASLEIDVEFLDRAFDRAVCVLRFNIANDHRKARLAVGDPPLVVGWVKLI
jgi:hypothetical protein